MVAFQNIKLITRESKLRSFQYRLLLYKVFVNDVLHKWGKVPTNECTFVLCELFKNDMVVCVCVHHLFIKLS